MAKRDSGEPDEAKPPRPATPAWKMACLLVGVVLILAGGWALWYGIKPAGGLLAPMMEAFGGGPPPDDLGDDLESSQAELKDRVVWDVLGFVGLMAGFILAKVGMSKPKPKPIEELVEEKVQERLARMDRDGVMPGASNTFPPAAPADVRARAGGVGTTATGAATAALAAPYGDGQPGDTSGSAAAPTRHERQMLEGTVVRTAAPRGPVPAPLPPSGRPCRFCKKPLVTGAQICGQCGSFQ